MLLSLDSLDYRVSNELYKITGVLDLYFVGYSILNLANVLIKVDNQVLVHYYDYDEGQLRILINYYSETTKTKFSDPRDYANAYRNLLNCIYEYSKRLNKTVNLYINGKLYDKAALYNYNVRNIISHSDIIYLKATDEV